MPPRHRLFWIIFLLASLLSACQPSPEPQIPTLADFPTPTQEVVPPTSTPEPPTPTPRPTQSVALGNFVTDPKQAAYLRVIHAAPDIEAVDVLVETTRMSAALGFGQVTGKTPILAGNYNVKITPRATPETSLAQAVVNLQPGQSVVILFGGVSGSTTTRVYPEPADALRSGEARLTFINAVPDGAGASGWTGDRELTSPLGFAQASNPTVTSSGQTALSFRSGSQTLAEQNVHLMERTAYTYVLMGKAGNETILGFNEPVIGRPTIRIVNASPDVGTIDVQLDGAAFIEAVAAGETSVRQTVDSGAHTLSVYAGDTPLLENIQINANADENLSLVLMGGTDQLLLYPHRENLSRTPISTARVSFVNALESVDLAGVGRDNTLIDDIFEMAYGQGSQGEDFSAGQANLFWQRFERGTPGEIVETAQNVNLEAGHSYLYVLTGNSERPLILSDNVGVDEKSIADVVGIEALPTATTDAGTYIRFINALSEGPVVDVLINGLPIVSALQYSQGSSFVSVPAGQYTITVQISDAFTPILVTTFSPPPPGYYTAILFNRTSLAEMMMITDTDLRFDSQVPYLRLINLSLLERAEFGLVTAAPTDPVTPTPEVTAEATAGPRLMDLPTIPLNTRELVSAVGYRDMSGQIPAPIDARDLLVTYPTANRVGARLHGVIMTPGRHYDVIAFELIGQSEVRAFIVPYPER